VGIDRPAGHHFLLHVIISGQGEDERTKDGGRWKEEEAGGFGAINTLEPQLQLPVYSGTPWKSQLDSQQIKSTNDRGSQL
jgi:hypothetical protein